jgi:hypothetical protein
VTGTDDDLVPVSVRLGEVVPPEDPEDWTRPLTWVAALGMLAGPLATLAWFLVAPPTASVEETDGAALVLAGALAAGAALTGATQIGRARAWTATLGAGLFGALVIVILGAALANERQVVVASPTVAHAVAAAIGGLAGSATAAVVAAAVAGLRSRPGRALLAMVLGAATGAFVTGALFT